MDDLHLMRNVRLGRQVDRDAEFSRAEAVLPGGGAHLRQDQGWKARRRPPVGHVGKAPDFL